MNKINAVLGTVIILLSVVCGILYYYPISDLQNQIGQLENQVSELELENLELQNQANELEEYINNVSDASQVRITGITYTPTHYLLTIVDANVTVTVKNFGTNNVSGLSLRIKDTFLEQYYDNVTLGTIKSGEEKNFIIAVKWSDGRQSTFVTTLLIDDIILDEHATGYSAGSYSKVY